MKDNIFKRIYKRIHSKTEECRRNEQIADEKTNEQIEQILRKLITPKRYWHDIRIISDSSGHKIVLGGTSKRTRNNRYKWDNKSIRGKRIKY